MTNYEKYRDEIIKTASESADFCSDFIVPKTLKTMKYECSDISCDVCHALFSVWLIDEYKESEIDWSKVPVDTKIYVRDYEGVEWNSMYFAKYENEKVYSWSCGGTSWSCDKNEIISWEYAKLAEEENL